jgi:hypothetical protein
LLRSALVAAFGNPRKFLVRAGGCKAPSRFGCARKLSKRRCFFAYSTNHHLSQIEPYIALEEFTPEAVSKVSRACTSICMWVRAMHLYNTVALSVAPKREALTAAQATLDKTLAELAAAQVRWPGGDEMRDGTRQCSRVGFLDSASHRMAGASATFLAIHGCAAPLLYPKPLLLPQARLAAVEQKIVSLEAAFQEATAKKAALAAQVGWLQLVTCIILVPQITRLCVLISAS